MIGMNCEMIQAAWRVAIFLVLLFVTGCSGEEISPGSFTVAGYVRMGGIPAAGVSVVMDNAGNWTTATDSSGYFRIIGVTPALRTISLSLTAPDGSFTDQKFSTAVQGDVFLPSLTLPVLIHLRADSLYRGNGIRLVWRQTDAPEFRRYRLFRRVLLPIDENSGTPVTDVTTPADTTYADTLVQAGAQYYYRIYVFNELVRVCGSNTVGMTAR